MSEDLFFVILIGPFIVALWAMAVLFLWFVYKEIMNG